MATEAHVNGGAYGHHQPGPYHPDHYHNANPSMHHHQPSNTSTPAPPPQEPKEDIPKSEVAWYFVEQYYTTLSRNPETLHLFYSESSQFIIGDEAEPVGVSVGIKVIRERIKRLGYHDAKVKVLNVDSQPSFKNILVCVIGELSNKSEPPRKFVQNFVLAEQKNGYFVLNDIFRFLIDDEEAQDEVAAEQSAAAEPATVPAEEQAAPQPAQTERQADSQTAVQQVDQKLQAAASKEPESQPEAKAQETAPAEEPQEVSEPVAPTASIPAEELPQEKPKEPEPTPVVSPPKPATPVVEKENVAPVKPASMTWASIASSNTNKPTPVPVAAPVAVPQLAPVPQPKAAPVEPQPAPTNGESVPDHTSTSSGSEWQTAGRGRDENVHAYIKNVNEKVDAALLKETLSRFGKLKYFDVSRQRSCAFVEFYEAAGYRAAVKANPIHIDGQPIYVEERRPRNNAFGGNGGFNTGRGGAGRGRGDRTASQGRGAYHKDSGRFNHPRGRGGSTAPKGRPQPQVSS